MEFHATEMTYRDIIIIGGGAAGLMAAIGAGNYSRAAGHPLTGGGPDAYRPLILEKMPRPGRKIMITGKGRCNFTNVKPWNEFSAHIHPKAALLKPAFHNLPPEALSEMFRLAGLETVVERGDRAFPASHRSADVVDTLVRMARQCGAEILCNKEVTDIHGISPDKTAPCAESVKTGRAERNVCARFSVECSDGSRYACRKLIIATGGLSYPASGSTGDGFRWAEECGIRTNATFPSLTAIVPAGYKATQVSGKHGRRPDSACSDRHGGKGHIDRSIPLSAKGKALEGIQLKNTGLAIYSGDSLLCEESGDIDFTDGGLEGPAGFKVSRKCVKAISNGNRLTAVIDLKPAVSPEDLEKRISGLWQEIGNDRRSKGKSDNERLTVLLGKLIPRDLIRGFMLCNPGIDCRRLPYALKNWKMDIAGYVGYERCVITAGGIDASEISPKTLESRKIHGLYFAGEVLDLDGDTGGYNLHIAFSTGYLAGQSAAGSIIGQTFVRHSPEKHPTGPPVRPSLQD